MAIAKSSFNASTESIRGIGRQRQPGHAGAEPVRPYYNTDESREGVRALLERRKPDFRKLDASKG